MNYPKELKYVKSHEWIRKEEDGMVVIGITDYAQDALGDLVKSLGKKTIWMHKVTKHIQRLSKT